MFPPEGYEVINLRHNLKGGAMMEFVPMITLVIAVAIYLMRKDIFVSKVKFKAGLKGIEFEMCAKEKNDSPSKNDRSNR